MMVARLQRYRRAAAERQKWRCHYCQCPIWEDEPDAFSQRYGLTLRQAKLLRCTAEHVTARCDGGTDAAENLVASCLFCNRTRHKANRPKQALLYLAYVRNRMRLGRWHSFRPAFS